MKKRLYIIFIVLILCVVGYQQKRINDLNYCSKAWYDMYWSQVETNLVLEQKLEDIKILESINLPEE